ncbi:nectin-4-like [Saccostrea cucullata]|uniref:nectin-4-like n=1 Tax=Saccostrea cuccullata TaxID=36930 RepID=UPI002ED38C4A
MEYWDNLFFTLHLCCSHLSFLPGGSLAGTVSTAGSLTATIGGSVDFTCTYTLDSGDTVYPGTISWQVKTGSGTSDFTNMASFSPPGGSNSFTDFANDYKNRSELLNVTANGANSYVVVMRINEVMCSDENHYRCSILFINTGSGPITRTKETSLTVRAPAEQPYDIPVPVPDNIEENMEVTLSCTANVGKPPGQIRWWRYRNGITAPQEMTGVSTATPLVQEGVCVFNVTSKVTYRMTKYDDQTVWRCFVDNELLTMPDRDKPNQESKRVNVFFKVNVPMIKKLPDIGADSQYSVGSSVTLTCQADGNPTPGIYKSTTVNRYLWTFKANPNDKGRELSSKNGTLLLTNLQENDTGSYACTAFNGFNGKFFNASRNLSLQIVKSTSITSSTTAHIVYTTGYFNPPTTQEGNGFPTPKSKLEIIAGGTIGGVVFVVLVALLIFNRRYQILCFERKQNSSIRKTAELYTISGTQSLETEKRAHYEGLTRKSRDQEDGYDVIRPPKDNGSYTIIRQFSATYEELKHRKEEHGYEKLPDLTIIFN